MVGEFPVPAAILMMLKGYTKTEIIYLNRTIKVLVFN